MEDIKYQTELKNGTTEVNNTIEGFNSVLDDAEEWISDMEDKVVEIIRTAKRKRSFEK